MMDTAANSRSGEHSASATKRYTREELFKLAKFMKEDGSMKAEELIRFETADLSQYNLAKTNNIFECDDTKFKSVKPISNFGRQYSGLEHEYSSLTDYRSYAKSKEMLSQNKAPISRMSSNPTIKYRPSDQDGVSRQVKARYVRLIESFSKTPKENFSMTQSSTKQNVSRADNSWLSQNRSVERPTNLFGSLRKEPPRPDRRHSEEPLSLPYTGYMRESEVRNSKLASTALNSTTNTKPLLDDTSSSPITRISAIEKPCFENTGPGNAAEEDDFDITSLISITILSDIKTMRHEQLQSTERQSLNRQKSRNHESMIKPITRARTSTDFTYNDRANRDVERQRVHPNYQTGYPSSGSESLNNITSNWTGQQNFYEIRKVAQGKPQENAGDDKVVDQSVSNIIKTFKAQVWARAQETTVESGSQEDSKDIKDEPVRGSFESGGTSVEQKVLAVRETKADITSNAQHVANKTTTSSSASIRQDSNRVSQTQNIETGKEPNEKVESKIGENLGGGPVKQQSQAARPSNIPRLIRLVDPVSSRPCPKTETLRDTVKVAIKTSDAKFCSKEVDAKRTLVGASKIVSQYKLLRGKSLADEIDDVKSK